MTKESARTYFATVMAFALASCGGGGGTEVASTPNPPPAPPPTASTVVNIFKTPTVREYVSVGASTVGPGGNLETYDASTDRFGPISTADADQAHIRYTSGGYYEVKLAGADWDRLVPYKGLVDADFANNNYFQPANVAQNHGYVVTRNARNDGYLYSELTSWGSSAQNRFGYTAIGLPTAPQSVPVTGSATFNGVVSGSTDIMVPDNLYGGYSALPIGGDVTLNFDFGAGTLGGSIHLFLNGGMNPEELGTFAFRDTVYSAGSTTYSGSFNTTVSGQNFFLGRFTGPGAEETIGAWAIPFRFERDNFNVPADGQVHQAFGAWIARRGN